MKSISLFGCLLLEEDLSCHSHGILYWGEREVWEKKGGLLKLFKGIIITALLRLYYSWCVRGRDALQPSDIVFPISSIKYLISRRENYETIRYLKPYIFHLKHILRIPQRFDKEGKLCSSFPIKIRFLMEKIFSGKTEAHENPFFLWK